MADAPAEEASRLRHCSRGALLLTGGRECDTVLVLSSRGRVPEEFEGYQTPSGGGVRLLAPDLRLSDALRGDGAPALVWDVERADISEWVFVRSLRLRETLRSIPLLILTAGREIPKSSDLGEFLRTASAARGSGPIVLVDPSGARRGGLATQLREGCGIVELVEIGRVDEIPALLQDVDVGLFILNALDDRDLRFIRDIQPRSAGRWRRGLVSQEILLSMTTSFSSETCETSISCRFRGRSITPNGEALGDIGRWEGRLP